MSTKTQIIILAAGKGKRMKHSDPKVLVPIKGQPMILKILETATKAGFGRPLIVVGHRRGEIQTAVGRQADFVVQAKQLGTGHAVKVAMSKLQAAQGDILVVYGDSSLIRAKTLRQLVTLRQKNKAALSLITFRVPDFKGNRRACLKFGRIIRDKSGKFLASCVEYKDATRRERAIREVNSGFYCFEAKWLKANLSKIKARNISGEYYLTDLIALAVGQGEKVVPYCPTDWTEGLGANSLADIKQMEKLR
jgi:bifunctional UDP-N-acetylglucosamine pyrophosphorylase / glucosamine-1-phosphate N-acetyltransferase